MSILDLVLRFTQFQGSESLEGQDVEIPWSDFVEYIEQEGFVVGGSDTKEEKNKVPLFLPVDLTKNSNTKSKQNVERVNAAVLDIDGISLSDLQDLKQRAADSDIDCLIYTTWSNANVAEDHFKIRLIAPLSRPVEIFEWELFWPVLNNFFGGYGDTSCTDPSRGYFLPSRPSGSRHKSKAFILHIKGTKALDVDHLLSGVEHLPAAEKLHVKSTGREKIDRERIRLFAKKRQRSSVEYKAWMGKLLLQVLAGESFAQKGERDNTVFKLAQDLGSEFPEGDPLSIAEVFRPSLSGMNQGMQGDEITVEDVAAKIERAQTTALQEIQSKKKLEQSKEVEQKKLQAKRPQYTKESISKYLAENGIELSIEEFRSRLIIQKNNKYFVFMGSGYELYSEKELSIACRDLLVPAKSLYGASAFNVSDKGFETIKSPIQLMHEYGTVALTEVIDLRAKCTYYDEAKRQLVESPNPIRSDIKPVFHKEVDDWLRELCISATDYNPLLDWLSLFPDLNRTLAMLLLSGPKGIGKTSLALGLAKLWGSSPSRLMNAFETHNTEILRCPLYLADDGMPEDKGKIPTDRLRSLISAEHHAVNPKNRTIINTLGCCRIIAALNNLNLKLSNVNSKEDVEAIQERLFIVKVSARAMDYFDRLNFVDNNWIAEHTLWLSVNRKIEHRKRFGVDVKTNEFEVAANLGADLAFGWLHWFLRTRKLEEDPDPPAFVAKGHLYINHDLVYNKWNSFYNDKFTSNKTVRKHISLVVEGESIRVGTPTGFVRRYTRVNNSLFESYLDSIGEDSDFLTAQLCLYTKSIYEKKYIRLPRYFKLNEEDIRQREGVEQALEQRRSREDLDEDDESYEVNTQTDEQAGDIDIDDADQAE